MKDHGPWKIKSSEIKYKNPWIEVREDQVIRPDGKDGAYGVYSQSPGVSTLALDDDNNAYLVNEFRYAVGHDSLETASGAIEGDERPIDTAKRELQEDAGIIADDWIDFGRIEALSSTVNAPQQLFLARKLRFTDHARESVEVMEVRKIKFSEAVEMVMDGRISYGPSCVLILKAARFLEKEGV
jgi:ADP-ribose pyrophosphatase